MKCLLQREHYAINFTNARNVIFAYDVCESI